MANVDVTIATVQSAKKSCIAAAKELSSAAKNLSSQYTKAGSGWKDSKYKELGEIINDCNNAIKAPMGQLQDCYNKLAEIEKILQEYESL